MRAHSRKSFLLLGAVVACRGSDGPSEPIPHELVVPPLESVAFSLLGSGKIAFQRLGPITANYLTTYVVDATGSTSSHIFDNKLAYGPVISSDGQRLAYTAYIATPTGWDIHVARVDGTGVVKVTNVLGEGTPHWTPDGSKLVFAMPTQSDPNIFMQSPVANAGDLTQLTHFTPGPGGLITCPYLLGTEERISISGDGRITFACLSGEIDVLASDGTLAVKYAPSRADPSHWPNVFDAEWSPDGTRVAFIETTSDRDAGLVVSNYAVKVMNADATNVTTLVSVPIPSTPKIGVGGGWAGQGNWSICWMPDGSRLVFTIPETQIVGHLWVVRSDGTALTQLTSAPEVYDRSVSCSRS